MLNRTSSNRTCWGQIEQTHQRGSCSGSEELWGFCVNIELWNHAWIMTIVKIFLSRKGVYFALFYRCKNRPNSNRTHINIEPHFGTEPSKIEQILLTSPSIRTSFEHSPVKTVRFGWGSVCFKFSIVKIVVCRWRVVLCSSQYFHQVLRNVQCSVVRYVYMFVCK